MESLSSPGVYQTSNYSVIVSAPPYSDVTRTGSPGACAQVAACPTLCTSELNSSHLLVDLGFLHHISGISTHAQKAGALLTSFKVECGMTNDTWTQVYPESYYIDGQPISNDTVRLHLSYTLSQKSFFILISHTRENAIFKFNCVCRSNREEKV